MDIYKNTTIRVSIDKEEMRYVRCTHSEIHIGGNSSEFTLLFGTSDELKNFIAAIVDAATQVNWDIPYESHYTYLNDYQRLTFDKLLDWKTAAIALNSDE